MHRFAQALVLCYVITLLCGCHRHDDTAGAKNAAVPKAAPAVARTSEAATIPPRPAAPSPTPAGRAAKVADDNHFRVSSVTLGSRIDTSYAVTVPATRFSAETHTIYASVATTGHTAGARLDARWRYLEGQGVPFNELSQSVAADGPAITTFEVQNPNRWPAGKYVVEISLDGKPAAQQAFEVTVGK